VAFLRRAGREFHAVAAAAGNKQSPSVERRVVGMISVVLPETGGDIDIDYHG